MAEKAQANDLLVSTSAEKHTLDTPMGALSVWIKDLSWIERQEALGQFVSLKPDGDGGMTPTIDFGGYWRFVFTHCITKTDPSLTTDQLLSLNPEVGEMLQDLLPGFEDLMSGLTSGPLV